jgi:hypothetical protein
MFLEVFGINMYLGVVVENNNYYKVVFLGYFMLGLTKKLVESLSCGDCCQSYSLEDASEIKIFVDKTFRGKMIEYKIVFDKKVIPGVFVFDTYNLLEETLEEFRKMIGDKVKIKEY